MNTFKKLMVAGCTVATLGASGAEARGFFAGVLKDVGVISEKQRKQLDDANAAAGRPVEHAVAAGANAIVPGSGTALEAGWAIQRSR